MKKYLGLAALALGAVFAATAAETSAPSAAPSPSPSDEPTQTDAQRAALETGANNAAKAAQAAIEQANPKHLPAFPGAEGFGALATGGRGGEIVHVTNLNDSGPGSFRDAVSKPNRVVVFDVGGIIKLAKEVTVSSNITLLGQTAPGEGICFYNNSVSLGAQSNIIVRYLRFRQGIAGDRGKKALGMDKSSNIIIDHCSIEWGRWDDLGITVGSTAVTAQNCIVAEGINPQSFGALIDTVTNISLSHNLWMSNESRNPKVKGTVQYINNVVYNWGGTGLCGGHSAANHSIDVINNYFIKGPSSNDRFAGEFYATDHVFQEGNYVDLDMDGKLDGKLAAPADFHRAEEKGYTLPTYVKEPAMHPAIKVTVESAEGTYAKIVADAGCSLHRDTVDSRLISELKSLGKEGKTLPHTNAQGEALAGGLGEIKGGPLPKYPADAAKLDASGYMNIEVYANSLVAPASSK